MGEEGEGNIRFFDQRSHGSIKSESAPIVLNLLTPFFCTYCKPIIDEVEGRLELAKRSREQWTLSQISIIFQHLEGSLELKNFKEYSQSFTGLPH